MKGKDSKSSDGRSDSPIESRLQFKSTGLVGEPPTGSIKLHRLATNHFVVDLPLDAICDSSQPSRLSYDPAFAEALARSIRMVGLIEPIIVRPIVSRPGYYETISGHYRRRAFALLREPTICAVVRSFTDREAALAVAVCNEARR